VGLGSTALSQIICSIGGNVAENSGGVHCLKYGVTTNHVRIKLVLPDGSIVMWGQIRKCQVTISPVCLLARGTLGIATEITLNSQNS